MVCTLTGSEALPLLAQIEVKLIVTGVVTGTPVTGIDTLVVAYGERGFVPRVKLPSPALTELTLKPMLVEMEPPAPVAAVMVVAPAAVKLAASIWIKATPDALVSAVPVDGVMVTSVAEVENVTTLLGDSAPDASLTVAVTLAGLPKLIFVTVAPVVGSVSAIEMDPEEVEPPEPEFPLGVVVCIGVDVESLGAPPQPASTRAVTHNIRVKVFLIFAFNILTTPQ